MIKKIIKETMRNFKNKRENFLNEEDNSITRKSDYKNLMNYNVHICIILLITTLPEGNERGKN